MASWKKVIVSGSVAELNNLFVTNSITASAYSGDGSALTGVAATSLNSYRAVFHVYILR